ncbi:MAG: MOSC N-terminal beta barrel domain-containing protein [Pseudomonadota bacterium]
MAEIARLYRHPIKGVGAEELPATDVRAGQTLPGDRLWAVAHEAAKLTEGWNRCANFIRGAKSAQLMAITAKTEADTVTLSHPDRPDLRLNPDGDPQRLIDWVRPLCDPNRAQPSQVIKATQQGMTDAPFPSVSILNYASLRVLEGRAGRSLDPRRFRGNIWVDFADPWEEWEWVGNRLLIGGVVFEVRERITRCLATHANPETGQPDTDMLGILEETLGERDFGVYAVAETGGRIAVGDPVAVQ